ncbi:MAG: hypothetical protein EOT04_01515 [Candidatus Chaera renei]|uniref:Uncharacterized protein n=1 Tax=Candidatus Chaera renei TaxID=2506947 RepID=A0A4Q0AIX4_9BACT|nr:MAG: hypothetical protein EOT04_01515 [Candidatus Chaera renei]
MDSGNAKQLVVERIKNSANVLVTVSASPSVDELSAALALTLMLNKMDKHSTAVFSGALPPAIQFLEPDKTFESTVDSLRDFIIALDKEKADRLRFKVEDDVVKIYITPYRATLSEQDLTFSQGDFNVELILALGVEKREELDKAIVAHGRILHDAAVVTINAKKDSGNLGSVDWQDASASSLCEMLMSLSEALQPGLLDQQIATALLTGIVAATERFSNTHTTPRVMTMAAQLMAAGANQQLIATKLQTGQSGGQSGSVKIQGPPPEPGGGQTPAKTDEPPDATPPAATGGSGEIKVDHETPEEISKRRSEDAENRAEDLADQAEKELGDKLSDLAAATGTVGAGNLKQQLEEEVASVTPPPPQTPPEAPQSVTPSVDNLPAIGHAKSAWMNPKDAPPTMGGTLNATSEEALENRLREEADDRNRTILDHAAPPATAEPGDTPPEAPPAKPSADLFSLDFEEAPLPPPAAAQPPAHEPTLAELEAQALGAATESPPPPPAATTDVDDDLDRARQAVNEALTSQAAAEAPPQAQTPPAGPPYMPPLPDFGNLPPLPPLPPAGNATASGALFNDAGSLPPPPPAAPPVESQNGADPGQFKIPPAA